MKIRQILLAVLLAILSVTVFAGDIYTTKSAVSVRKGAGKKHRVLFNLQKGAEVEVLSTNGSWYQINHLGQSGYVYSKYLRYSKTQETANPDAQRESNMALPALFILIVAFIIGLYVFTNVRKKKVVKTVTQFTRGTRSERALVLTLLRSGLPADTIFHDLYVKKEDGNFSQIDLVTVTDVGIIVFEVKDYSGWLYGTGKQQQWTQVLAYGKQKYRFYNPIMQNNRHISSLRKKLTGHAYLPFFSIVVFYGDCEFKEMSFVPAGTFLTKSNKVLDVLKIIFKENKIVNYNSKEDILQTLKEAVANGEITENQVLHTENIKNMLGKHRIFE